MTHTTETETRPLRPTTNIAHNIRGTVTGPARLPAGTTRSNQRPGSVPMEGLFPEMVVQTVQPILKILMDTILITAAVGVLLLLRGEGLPQAVEEIMEVNILEALAPVEAVAVVGTAVRPGAGPGHRGAEVLSTLGNTVDSTTAAPVVALAAVAATDTHRRLTIGTSTRVQEDRHLLPDIIHQRLHLHGADDKHIPEAAVVVITIHPIDTGIPTPAAAHLLHTIGVAPYHRTRATQRNTREGGHLLDTPSIIDIILNSSNNSNNLSNTRAAETAW